MGGAYVGPSQDHVLKVIHELGLSTYKVYEEGDLMHYRKVRKGFERFLNIQDA